MSKKTREQVSTVVRYTVLILVGFVMFYPMLWMVGASFKASNNEIYSTISFLPKSPSFQAYIDGWTATGNPYSLYLINTFKIVICGLVQEKSNLEFMHAVRKIHRLKRYLQI